MARIYKQSKHILFEVGDSVRLLTSCQKGVITNILSEDEKNFEQVVEINTTKGKLEANNSELDLSKAYKRKVYPHM